MCGSSAFFSYGSGGRVIAMRASLNSRINNGLKKNVAQATASRRSGTGTLANWMQWKDEAPPMDVNDRIRSTLLEHPIVLFMKGTPQLPMDGFSHRAVEALGSAGAEFHSVNVLADPQMRAE